MIRRPLSTPLPSPSGTDRLGGANDLDALAPDTLARGSRRWTAKLRAMSITVLVALAGCGDGDDGGSTGTSSAATSIGPTTSTPTSEASGLTGTSDDSSTGAAPGTTLGESSDSGAASESGAPDGPPTLVRIGETFVVPTLAASMPKRFADAAHDAAGDVYLVVNGNGATSGSFVSADGAPLGQPFAVAETDAYTQGVRVWFGGAAFLVAWHDNRDAPNVSKLRGRLVAWDGGGPAFAGPDFVIGGDGTYSEMPPAIAWSATTQTFMVVWHTGEAHDIAAQRVAADGALVGGILPITADADWQSDAGVAWHAGRDEWLVVYTHAGATTEVRARRLASDGAPIGEPATLTTAAGTWLAQATYVPDTADYLTAWFEGEMKARRVDADGVPLGDAFSLAPGYGNYDGYAVAYNAASGTFAAVFHGTTDEDFALAFTVDGTTSAVLEATASRGADGHFNPHVVAHSTRPEWLLVTSLGFASVVAQRLGE